MSKQLPKIEYKPVGDLIYDPTNPRLPNSVNGSNEKQVINWMLSNENVLELMASIAEEGYFPAEPLLVAPGKKNKFIVVEGNRRLTAIKLLLNPDLATSKTNSIREVVAEAKALATLEKIPVIVFDDAEEIQQYLGYRHITGVQPWDSLAKARYLKRMQGSLKIKNLKELYRTLAKIIGSRADHVKLLLTGLEVYEAIEENSFFKIKGLDETSVKFGVLYTALNKSNVAQFVGVDFNLDRPAKNINTKTLKELSEWMFEENNAGLTRIGESRNLTQLSKILDLKNKKALSAFRSGKSLQDAVLLTDEPTEIFRTSISDSLSKLEVARDYIHLVDDFEQNHASILDEISKLGKILVSTVRTKLQEEDEE